MVHPACCLAFLLDGGPRSVVLMFPFVNIFLGGFVIIDRVGRFALVARAARGQLRVLYATGIQCLATWTWPPLSLIPLFPSMRGCPCLCWYPTPSAARLVGEGLEHYGRLRGFCGRRTSPLLLGPFLAFCLLRSRVTHRKSQGDLGCLVAASPLQQTQRAAMAACSTYERTERSLCHGWKASVSARWDGVEEPTLFVPS